MGIREIEIEGKPALSVDTEEEFAQVFDRGLPIEAPREVVAAFGIPGADENGDLLDTDEPSAEFDDLALEDQP